MAMLGGRPPLLAASRRGTAVSAAAGAFARRPPALAPFAAAPAWGAAGGGGGVAEERRAFSSKGYNIKRVQYPWKTMMLKYSWEFLKQEMVTHFEAQPQRDSTVHIRGELWPRFTMKEELLEQDRLPALIGGWGPSRRVVFSKAEMERIAFDEPEAHLSHLFKGRLFRVYVGNWVEECVVDDISVHPVERELYFIRFRRHVPGKVTALSIPVSISGLWGCPGYRAGGHVDLAMPTIKCECVGEKIPPPFVIDVTNLKLESPYSKITISDIKNQLPEDGLTRFSRDYTGEEEVVMCYDPKSIPETPLPPEWQDPNFNHRGGRYHLTYTGFWPKQTTRA